MKLDMRLQVSLLSEPQLRKALEDAITVWRRVPFRVQGTTELFDLLRTFGCSIDGECVRFPSPVIDRVMDRIGDERRKGEATHGVEQGWPSQDLVLCTHGQALLACDLETNAIRPATKGDLQSWCHAVDALGGIERRHPTFIPTDVPRHVADFEAFATILLNSAKPHPVSVYSKATLPYFIEACAIAKGSVAEVRRDPIFHTTCWVTSPFMITRENIEIAMEARRLLGTPIVFGHMPVAGASAPVTLAGSLVQNTAESLALCGLRLAIDDRPHGIVGTSTMIDMRDGCPRQAGPDVLLHRLAASQMHSHLFGGHPEMSFSYTAIAAQTVSAQSLFEKALTASFNIAAGCRLLGIGSLACSDVGSPVQLVLDYEMCGFFAHLLRDVAVDDDRIGLPTILSTAPRGGYFLETDHTARFYREESWLPSFFDSRLARAWAQSPSDMIARARSRAREIFSTAANQCPLTDPQRRAVLSLVREAEGIPAESP